MFFINRHRYTGNDSSLFANSCIGSINDNNTNSNISCTNNNDNDKNNQKNTKLMTDKTIFYDDMWKYDIPDEAKHFSINLAKSWSLCNNKSHGNWMNHCNSDTMTEKNKKCQECEELEQEHEFNNGQSNVKEKKSILNSKSKIEEECKCCCRHSNNNVKDRSSTFPVQHNNKSIMINSNRNNYDNNKNNGIIRRISQTSRNVEFDKCKNNSDSNSCSNAKIVFTDWDSDDKHRHNDIKKMNMENKKRCSNVGRTNGIEEELVEQEEKEEEYQCSIERNKRLSFTPYHANISLTKPAMTSLQTSDNNNEQSVNNKYLTIPPGKAKYDKRCESSKYKAIKNENNKRSEYSHHDIIFDKSSADKSDYTTLIKNEEIIHDDNVSLPWTSSARSCTTYSSQQSLLELSNTLKPNAHLPDEWETLEEHPNSSLEFASGESSLVAEPSHQPALHPSCSPLAMEMSTSLLEESLSLCNEECKLYCQELQHTKAQKMMEHLDLDEEVCQMQSEQSTNNMQIFSCTNTDEKECSLSWSCTPYNDDPLHSHDDYGLTESTKNSSLATNQNSIFSSPLSSNVMKDVDILNKGDNITIVNNNNNNNNYTTCTQRT